MNGGRVSDPQQLKLSWSRLRTHNECAVKGQLLADRYKSPLTNSRPYFHGTVVDQAMRQWLSQDQPEPGWMAAHINQILEEAEAEGRATGDGVVRWKSRTDKQELAEFCRTLVIRLESILTELALPYDWDPARRFSVPITIPYLDGSPAKVRLVGEIDLLAPSVHPIGVWDLKATQNDQYWRKVTGQLLFYEIAIWGMTGQWPAVSGLIQPMCDEPVLRFYFTEQHRREMFARICSTALEIWGGNLRPKADSEGCEWCEVRQACPKYKVVNGRAQLLV